MKSASPKQRILIVDDELGLVRLMKLILEKTDRYQVHGETDPTAALDVAMRFQPDLILLDLIMPGMDGVELAARFRATSELQRKPIIFVSATVSRHEGRSGRIAGLPAIPKPLGMRELIEVVDASCPVPAPEQEDSGRARIPRPRGPRRGGRTPGTKKDDNLKDLLAQVHECVSGPDGTLAPASETKILNVNQDLRILSMTETWTYPPSGVLRLKIDRTEPDLAMRVTVSVNQGRGRYFAESKTRELLAYLRKQVAALTA